MGMTVECLVWCHMIIPENHSRSLLLLFIYHNEEVKLENIPKYEGTIERNCLIAPEKDYSIMAALDN